MIKKKIYNSIRKIKSLLIIFLQELYTNKLYQKNIRISLLWRKNPKIEFLLQKYYIKNGYTNVPYFILVKSTK